MDFVRGAEDVVKTGKKLNGKQIPSSSVENAWLSGPSYILQHPATAIIFADDMEWVQTAEPDFSSRKHHQSISRNSILFLIVPLRSEASLSAFCAWRMSNTHG